MKKVKVTKEVAEAIEALRSGVPSYGYWRFIRQFEEKDDVDLRFVITRAYFNEDVSLFIRAMFGDYEVEKTPEEKVAEYFQKQYSRSKGLLLCTEYYECVARMEAVQVTLNTLGIKIEGVNA